MVAAAGKGMTLERMKVAKELWAAYVRFGRLCLPPPPAPPGRCHRWVVHTSPAPAPASCVAYCLQGHFCSN